MNSHKILTLTLTIILPLIGYGQQPPKLPAIFSDHMVLQREMPIPIWGKDQPNQEIMARMNGQESKTRADGQGHWKLTLPAQKAGGPFQLTISGSSEVNFNDVMVGEVWICSGQSNMEWSVARSKDASQEIAQADHPKIRLFTVEHQIAFQPAADVEGKWQVCSPATVDQFSAVAYYFGRDLKEELDVPIGLINTSWGGSKVEPWMSAEAFENDRLKSRVDEIKASNYENAVAQSKQARKDWLTQFEAGDRGLQERWMDKENAGKRWEQMDIPILWESAGHPGLDGVVWFKKTFSLKAVQDDNYTLHLGPIDDSDRTYINGHLVGSTQEKWDQKRKYEIPSEHLRKGKNILTVRVEDTGGGGGLHGNAEDFFLHYGNTKLGLAGEWKYKIGTDNIPPRPPIMGQNYGPTVLYNGMIDPLIPYGIRGVTWYQGESNASQAARYAELFPMMIKNWRSQWGQGDFPFLFVQLANYMATTDDPNQQSNWAELRGSQTQTLAVKNTGMALAIDLGEAGDIHPKNKQDVGKRLALAAKKIAYGKDLVYAGPILKTARVEKDKVKLKFEHVGSGLAAQDRQTKLKGFAIAGKDGIYQWAEAEVKGKDEVVVWHPGIKSPRHIKYAWANNPGELNLVNSAGLPATPFKTAIP